MRVSTRNALRQLEHVRTIRDELRARLHDTSGRIWTVAAKARAYSWWQRGVSAVVAATLFIGPLTVTFEQSQSAAGVLAAGSQRVDDDAWQQIRDLAGLRVRFMMQQAFATPIVDPNAPITFQPKITQSTGANGGVPVVNITAPNAAGISLNQYQTFDIDPVGLILNNSLMSGTSLTGGNVSANPNLSGRTASVIVNQVTSTGAAYASLLNGPLEVFGAPATVVIANPNGITTRGTGFTNTIGVTLSTGTPQFLSDLNGTRTDFSHAMAVGYNVTGGHIQIEGNAGANGPGAGIEGTVGTIDLIAETIGVNAPLYAGNRINAIAGRQFVLPNAVSDAGTTYGTSSNGSVNTSAAINGANGNTNNGLAIDATAFGAMTAGQIQVISTAAGMGVRSDAQLAANAGDLLLSANGDVWVAGTAAQKQATVQSTGNVSMTGAHVGVGGYTISANGDVTSTGTLQSGAKLDVTAGGNLNLANSQANGDIAMSAGSNAALGDVQGGGALSVSAAGGDGAGDVNLNGTSVVSGATTLQAARDVNVAGQTNSGTLQVTAQRDVNVAAAVQTASDATVTATQGNINANANINGGANLTFSSGQDTLIAAQATAQNAVTAAAGRDLSVSGSLASGTTFNSTSGRDTSVSGSLLVSTDAQISAGRNLDVSGVSIVQHNGAFDAQNDVTGSGSIAFGQGGTLNAGHDVALTGKLLANDLTVTGANNVSLAAVQAGGAFAVTANGNAGGGDVTFNGNAASVGTTNVQAARDIAVNGTLAGGAQTALTAQRDVNIANAATVQSVGDLSVTTTTGSVTSTGTVNGAAALAVKAAQDVSLTGATSAVNDVTLSAGHDLTIGGSLAGQAKGALTAGHDIVAGGNSGFAGDVTATAGNNLSVTGALQGNAVNFTAANSVSLNNVVSNAALQVTTRAGDIAIGGTVTSLSTATLNAARDISVSSSGTLQSANALTVTGGRDTTNAGTVQSNADVTLTNASGNLTSTGNIQSGGNLNINAAQSVDLGAQGTSSLGDINVTAGQNLTMNGSVVAQGNGTFNAGNAINGSAAIALGLNANVTSGGDTNLTGSLRAGTVQTSAGGSASLHDVQAASTLSLNATNDLNITGAVVGGLTVVLDAGQNIGISGSVQSSSDMSLNATAGSIGSTGVINSNGAFAALAGTDINLGGTTTAASDATLNAARDVNVSGMLAGLGQGTFTAGRDIAGAGTLTFAQAATLAASRDIVQGGLVQGQSVDITAAGNATVNNIESASTIAVRANGTNTVNGAGNVTLTGAAAAAGAITVNANNDVSVTSSGKIASGTTTSVTAQRNINIDGAVESVGDAALNAQTGSLLATGGINSGGKLDITTGLDLSLGTSTSAVNDITLTAGRDALLNGTMIGGSNATVTAARDITGGGTQKITETASYAAQHDIALTGGVQANVVTAVGQNNAALHDVVSATTLDVTANGNAGEGDAAITGTATAPGAIHLTGARDVLVSGSLASGDALTLTSQRNVTVTGSVESTNDLNATAVTGSASFTGTAATAGAFNVVSALDTQLGGQIAAAKQVNVQAGRDIALTGAVAGQMDGVLNAGRDINGAGSAAFAQAATLTASHDLALTGALQGASVFVTGGDNAGLGSVQAVTGDLTVTANGTAGGGDVTFGGSATALGTMLLTGARDVTAVGAINTGGTTSVNAARNFSLGDINSTGDLALTSTSGNGSAGNVTTQGQLDANTAQAMTLAGVTTVGGDAHLTSGGDMTLTGGIGAQNTGTLTAGGNIKAGSVAFGQQATVSAGGSVNVTGAVGTNGSLAVTAGNDMSFGSAQAGGTLQLQAQGHNGAGDVYVMNDVASGSTVTVISARDTAIGGSVSSPDKLTITGGRDVLIGGSAGSNADIALTATNGNLGVGGPVTTQGNLAASAGGNLALLSGGLINGDTNVTSGGAMTLGGDLLGLGVANINAGGSINGGGSLSFGKDITLNAGGGVALGEVQGAGKFTATSNGDMSFGAATVVGDVVATSHAGSVAFNGQVQTGGNATISAANNASATGGISSMGTVNVTGASGNVTVGGVSSNGDANLHAGQTLTLSGNSVVAGGLALSGGNVTMSGSASGSKDITVNATGTVDASQSTIVSTNNLQVAGANVTLGSAIVGGTLDARASNQLSLVGSQVDVVGAATLVSQNAFYNASNVLSGGTLTVTAPNLTNAGAGSLASTGTTNVTATNFTNAGLVNGATTNINVAGVLNNTGGSLMAVNGLNITTGTLNNQNGIIFAGNPNTPAGPVTGDVSLTINGGGSAFYNAGGQLLAQRNMGLSAVNASFDPSQGTISYGGQLSLTAGLISNSGTWNFGGQGVTVVGLNGINNYGTITGTAPLSLTTYGTFSNFGQVTGNDVTFNGTLSNAAGAVIHADDVLTLNGNTTNRGTVEAGNTLNVSGGNYDNQGATTQSAGNANFSLGGTLLNTGGSIFAGNNVNINAGAVVNDQTAPSGSATSTTVVTNPTLIWSAVAGTQTSWSDQSYGGENGFLQAVSDTTTATLGDLFSPTGLQATGANASSPFASQPVTGSGTVTFNEYSVQVGSSSSGDSSVPVYQNLWYIGTGPDPGALASVTLALPTIYQTTVTQQAGTSGVISAGNSISLTANSLSNRGGQIAAQGSVTLNVQSLSNGAVAPASLNQSTQTIDSSQYSSFFAQLRSLGTIAVQNTGNPTGTSCDAQNYCAIVDVLPPNEFNIAPGGAPTATGYTTTTFPTGMVAAGNDLSIYGGNLVNAGLLYAGHNVNIGAASLQNQGGDQQNFSTQTGCAAGVPNDACGTAGWTRGGNPTTTTFGYNQNDATIYAGNDLVIAAGQINNTFGNLLAGHDIVIGGVGTTATSTTPAQSLNNTSGNIVAGNNITLNVSGAITNNLPPPVPVHENYGSKEQYSGCMTAGGYKESYCEGYVDQQSGSSSVISAGNNLQINAGSLTNIGSLIAAGNSATISVAGPVVNEAQTLNAYWHSHWVQETGDFSPDKRHDVWACGSVEECTALYGSAYAKAGGTIDPPTPVGNIAATIQAPNLSITSNGEIQNIGNVIGTSVTLTGQKLINGITTANTYTPRVNAPSQVISLSPASLPGLNLSMPRQVGAPIPTPVSGTASFVDQSLGASAVGSLSPQALLDNLPASLQPGSTLFYYNPQEEDLMLQQAALQQTGKASFIDGLSYDSKTGTSVTEQEKAYLYQNALDYAKANNLQLGDALTQTQVNALDKPMLWYVEQTVPDPSCSATGVATCPTITALMPQVYLPSDTSAMSAGGNITGTNVTLNFNRDGNGSILNTGSITASNTLTVNTNTLTNQANQVDVGQIWTKVKGGYVDETGTTVQPGGFMSAANMDLNVQTINQIGGALQQLNADGTVDQAGTKALLAQLQQQLGTNFTQTSVSDNLHTDFVAEGGFGFAQIGEMVMAVALSIVTAGAGAALVGAAVGSLEAAVANAAFSALVSSLAMDAVNGNFSLAGIAESVGVAMLTAGITNGITYNTNTSSFGIADWTQNLNKLGDGVQTLGQMAGTTSVVGTTISQSTGSTATTLSQQALGIATQSTLEAGVQTAIKGGSFLKNLETDAVSSVAAVAANDIGTLGEDPTSIIAKGSIGYDLAHAALGCASSAALGTGCAGGAIGGALSAGLNPVIDANGNIPPAVLASIDTLVSGSVAGALGFNAQGAVTAAQNETLNNWLNHIRPQPGKLSQAEQYQQAVTSGQQGAQDQLAALSAQNDQNLAQACAGGAGSAACQAQIQAAQAAGNLVYMKSLGGGLYYTYANPLLAATGPESFPSTAVTGPQFTAIPSAQGPSLGAATLDTMLSSPLAGAFGGMVYAAGGSDARAYSVAQIGLATDGVLAGASGYRLPEAPTLVATNNGLPSNLSGLANPGSIRFTQDSISSTFKDGTSLQDTIGALKSGVISPADLPPIRVYEQDGLVYTLDNRRLFATYQAGTQVNITPATAQEVSSQGWKFTTPNQGCIICVKGTPKP
ncbi:beta strand repeat-containing protein [Paraburkholderia hospita]|uniref:beta strand repeat-containing protein n=1 Tax=Paraburkholderia hospita TaxID=169430 RepID=UPI0002717949|nr:filamentous hemagglutinin N-terminal domain-containing protein [Paraburkholderia hospita]EUC12601.1 filamentous hemagglutinin family outer membrane protein [Burkholderia sp. BT03]SKC49215.1 filamentous hemagglutinin [Paraburkholderia hospita]